MGDMGTVFKHLKSCSVCGRGAGSLLERSEGKKVAGSGHRKQEPRCRLPREVESPPCGGDSSRGCGTICHGYPTGITASEAFVITPAELKLGPASHPLITSPLYCLDRAHPRHSRLIGQPKLSSSGDESLSGL